MKRGSEDEPRVQRHRDPAAPEIQAAAHAGSVAAWLAGLSIKAKLAALRDVHNNLIHDNLDRWVRRALRHLRSRRGGPAIVPVAVPASHLCAGCAVAPMVNDNS